MKPRSYKEKKVRQKALQNPQVQDCIEKNNNQVDLIATKLEKKSEKEGNILTLLDKAHDRVLLKKIVEEGCIKYPKFHIE